MYILTESKGDDVQQSATLFDTDTGLQYQLRCVLKPHKDYEWNAIALYVNSAYEVSEVSSLTYYNEEALDFWGQLGTLGKLSFEEMSKMLEHHVAARAVLEGIVAKE